MRFDGQMEFFFFGKKEPSPPEEPKVEASVESMPEGAQVSPAVSHVPVKAEEGDIQAHGEIDRARTSYCAELLVGLGLGTLAGQLKVVWNHRMRTTAGRAFWPEAKIELNPKLAEVAPAEVRGTLLHELAHLVAYARAGRRRIAAHGAEWRQACADVGIPGESATHSLPLPGRTMQRKWRYTCPSCGESFDRVRKMKRYSGCYACCKAHNGGYYHKKYRFVETKLD